MYCYTPKWTALQTTQNELIQVIFLLLKLGKLNWSACPLINIFSTVKKIEMIGRHGTNRAKEKLVHNFGHRISRNHNFGSLYERKGYNLKDL
jgi:hypothetical protein